MGCGQFSLEVNAEEDRREAMHATMDWAQNSSPILHVFLTTQRSGCLLPFVVSVCLSPPHDPLDDNATTFRLGGERGEIHRYVMVEREGKTWKGDGGRGGGRAAHRHNNREDEQMGQA